MFSRKNAMIISWVFTIVLLAIIIPTITHSASGNEQKTDAILYGISASLSILFAFILTKIMKFRVKSNMSDGEYILLSLVIPFMFAISLYYMLVDKKELEDNQKNN